MAATPRGSRTVRNCFPGAEAEITEPSGLLHSSEKKWKNEAAKPTSPVASARGFPCSEVKMRPSSCLFSSIRSPIFLSGPGFS